MPSLLNDDNAPSPASRYDSDTVVAGPKTNGHHQHLPQPRSPTSNDTFDDGSSRSSHSTPTSLLSASTAQLTAGISDATTMSANVPNGAPADGTASPTKAAIARKPLPNGGSAAATTADLPVPPQPALANGTKTAEPAATASPKEAQPRTSLASTRASSLQTSPVEMYIRQVNKGDVVTVESGASAPSRMSSTGLAPGSASTASPTLPATTASTPDPSARTANAPHRFSSPPQYQPTSAAGSASGGLQPPPPAGLKHRHTLEVPRLAPARASRDGVDAALTNGRFSPTTAATPGGIRRASLSLVRRNTRSLHSELPRDEVVPDEDALRWAEAYRQKRASKRKRMELEDDDHVLVGTKVDENHANWVTAYNMLTGIRVSVSRTNAKLDRPLTDADFLAKQKSTFDIAGNELVPSAKYDFKFKDYAPWVFRHLRALFRLDPADYLVSLTNKYILSELGSPGKSGSFFYFSRDYKYIIKTIHHAEHKFLRKVLKQYYDHVTENPNTLLSQFYGLHRVKIPYGKKIHFVVMNNLFPPHRDIHQTFDLKGSTVGRDYKEEDLAKNPRATLKDLNWLRRHEHLELGLEKKRLFLEQLNKDVRLLQRLRIMDYSLLIGIHDLQRGNEENLRGKTLQLFNPGGDNTPEDANPHSVLMRTPSKLENQRKARELRLMIKAERPIPIDQSNQELEGHTKDSVFYKDDGGFQATHENNAPGEEIYYLGVIDCLTHYGVIKKIEHFWKGLSSDKKMISAQPPQEYGERFLNFMSGITMSPEEAIREAEERARAEAAAAEVAAAAARDEEQQQHRHKQPEQQQEQTREREQGLGWSSSLRRKGKASQTAPAAELHPTPPSAGHVTSPYSSPEAEAAIRKGEREAAKSPNSEESVPAMTLKTTATAAGLILPTTALAAAPSPAAKTAAPHADRRESASQGALPVVDEAGEGSSTADASRDSRFSDRTTESDGRPLTPAKDGHEMQAGFGILSYSSRKGGSPPTPPTSAHLKPDSADSGYGVSGGAGRSRSGTVGSGSKVKVQLSRESLDKALPPLPRLDSGTT